MRAMSGARACKSAPLIYFMLMPHFSQGPSTSHYMHTFPHSSGGGSPLHYAATAGRLETARILVSAGADLNIQDE
jgi:ankyrin repeat protein